MKKSAATAIVFFTFLSWALVSQAQEPATGGARGSDRVSRMKRGGESWRERSGWMMFSSYSSLWFEEPAFSEVFGHDRFGLTTLGLGWYPDPRWGIDFSVGFLSETGHAVGELSGRASGEEIGFLALPLQLTARYRFLRGSWQWLVPSVYAGVDWWWFKEDNEFTKDVEGDRGQWRVGVDLDFLLDIAEPEAAWTLKKEYGIENTYFYVGYCWVNLSGGGEGIDFSGQMWTVGLRFEVVKKSR